MKKHFLLTLAAVAGLTMSAQAQYLTPTFSSDDTVNAEWQSFLNPNTPGGNAPNSLSVEIGGVTSGGTPSDFDIHEGNGVAFPVGSANIYSPFSTIEIDLTSTFNDFVPNNIILQIRTLGNEFDPSTVFLTADVDGTNDLQVAPHFTQEVERLITFVPIPGGSAESAEVITAFQWDFTDLSDFSDFSLLDNADFTIDFSALGSSLSLDVAVLDFAGGNYAFEQFVIPVPEPATGSLLLLGLGYAALRRRRA